MQEEAVLVVGADAAAQVAGSSSFDDACHFLLNQCLGGTVAPLDHMAHGHAVVVADDRDSLRELSVAITHFALGDAGLVQCFQDLLVHFTAMLQRGDRLPDQRLAAVEVGELGGDVVVIVGKRVLQGAVGVDDLQLRVGQVDAGGRIIQRGADAQVLAGNHLFGFDALAQITLHALHGTQQIAHLVGTSDVDLAIQLAAGNVVGHVHRATHGIDQRTRKQPHQQQAGADADQHGDDGQYRRCGIGISRLLGRGLGAGIVVGGQRLQCVVSLAMQIAGFADEGVDGVVRQIQLQHLGDRIIGGEGRFPVTDEGLEQFFLLGVVDQLRVAGNGLSDVLAQLG
ncbi:hypothetical protein D3C71_1149440 [compost metagenome]